MQRLLSLLILFILFSCWKMEKGMNETTVDTTTGSISRQQLFTQFPQWQEEYERYVPDSLVIKIMGTEHEIDAEIYLGTWCKDSRREVPRFFKIPDQSRFMAPGRVKLWKVDRSKKLPDGTAEDRNIQFVATFIFFRDGMEIGRIVEEPYDSLEKDILEIISTHER